MKKVLFILSILILPYFVSAQSSVVCTNIGVTLRHGSKDVKTTGSVYLLQQFLNSAGYDSGFADGKFGSKTKAAVVAFQSANNLTPDGIVGPITRTAIKQASCKDVFNQDTSTANSILPSNPAPSEPANQTGPNQDPVQDVILTEGSISSLRVRTDGVVNVGASSITVSGTIIAGARANTKRWFEITKNSTTYKLSETIITTYVSERNDNKRFEETVSSLESNTTYYFRACAGNDDLGQRTCGGTTSVKTGN